MVLRILLWIVFLFVSHLASKQRANHWNCSCKYCSCLGTFPVDVVDPLQKLLCSLWGQTRSPSTTSEYGTTADCAIQTAPIQPHLERWIILPYILKYYCLRSPLNRSFQVIKSGSVCECSSVQTAQGTLKELTAMRMYMTHYVTVHESERGSHRKVDFLFPVRSAP